MPFIPGTSGNPAGRPKGILTGRMLALRALDEVATEADVMEAMTAALREEALKRPMRFFRMILMPLFTKEMLLKVIGDQGAVQWISYMAAAPANPDDPSK